MRIGFRAIMVLMCALLLFTCFAPALADFGDFDSGGDYGGSDWDSDWDSDYGSGGGGGSSGLGILSLVILLPLYGISKGIQGSREEKRMAKAEREYKSVMSDINALKQADPGFDAEALSAWVRELYTHMQADWEAGDITDLKREFAPSAWSRFDTQLQKKKADGYTGHVRNIHFLSIDPIGWCDQGSTTYLDIHLRTSILSWNTRRDGTVSTGSTTTPKTMDYYWRVQRPSAARTVATPRACPDCGEASSPLLARCPNCGRVIERDTDAWVIWDIGGRPLPNP